jgi:hypothetical protein
MMQGRMVMRGQIMMRANNYAGENNDAGENDDAGTNIDAWANNYVGALNVICSAICGWIDLKFGRDLHVDLLFQFLLFFFLAPPSP